MRGTRRDGFVTPIRMDETGPHLRCRHCLEEWPLTLEYWTVQRNTYVRTDRCRACNREQGRLYQALRRLDPDFRVESADRSRQYRRYLKEHHPDLLMTHDRNVELRTAARAAEWRRRAA